MSIHKHMRGLWVVLMLPLCAGGAVAEPGVFGVAPFDDPEELTGEPRQLEYTVTQENLPRDTVLKTVTEFDGLYTVDARTLFEAITALDEYSEFVPRVVQSNGMQLSDDPPSWLQELTLSFRVLFFGEVYDYILRLDQADLDTAGSYGVEYRLEQSLDGKFSDIRGSWYVQELSVDEVDYTYVRHHNEILFAEESFGLETALKWFGPRDVRNNIMAFVDEARQRINEGSGG